MRSQLNPANPLVSVVIPVHNNEKTIVSTLDSVFSQTYGNIEVIVVDDRCTDGTIPLVAQRFPAVKIIQAAAIGASSARNSGFHASSGQFIQFLDSDDQIVADKIELQMVELLRHAGDSISFCLWTYFGEACTFREIHERRPVAFKAGEHIAPLQFLCSLWITGDFVPTVSWLVGRELILTAGLWDEDLSADQDGDFFGRMLMRTGSLCFLGQVKALYRKPGSSNISSQRNFASARSRLLVSVRLVSLMLAARSDQYSKKACFSRLLHGCYQAFEFNIPELGEAYRLERGHCLRALLFKRPYLINFIASLLGIESALSIRWRARSVAFLSRLHGRSNP